MAELSVGLLAAVGVPDRYEQLRPHRGSGLDDIAKTWPARSRLREAGVN